MSNTVQDKLAVIKVHDHHGHQIFIDPKQRWQFIVCGPEFDDKPHNVFFDSLKAACEEIEKRVNDSAKIAAQNIKLDVTVLTLSGQRVNITKINRQTSHLAGVEGQRYIYPNFREIGLAIEKRKQLIGEINKIDDILQKIQVNIGRGYGRISAEEYGRYVNAFKADLEEAVKTAREIIEAKKKEEINAN